MAHGWRTDVSPSLETAGRLPRGCVVAGQIVLNEAMFSTPLDQIAAAIRSHAQAPMAATGLASWNDVSAPDA
jgi:hypothetical protein